MIYFFFLLGILIHWAFILHSAMSKPDFEWRYFAVKNWWGLLFDLFIAFILAFNREFINDNYFELVGIQINMFSAPFLGYLAGDIGHRILKKLKAK